MNKLSRFKKKRPKARGDIDNGQAVHVDGDSIVPAVKYREYATKKSLNPKKETRVLGLDPSLRHFGWVLLDGKGEVLDHGTIDNKAPTKKEQRSKMADYNSVIRPIVLMCMNLCLMNPSWDVYIVREDYAYAAASSSDTLLKELGGILEWEINRIANDRAVLHYLPIPSVKKWSCGKGNADKDEVKAGVIKNFGVTLNSEHEYDAFAVASLGLAMLRPSYCSSPSAKQEEALVGLKDHHLNLR